MLKHIVIMKFKTGVTEEQVQDIMISLGALPGKIPQIRHFEFGTDILKSERSYDFALVAAFDDIASLKAYQLHPEHLPVLEKVKNACETILVVDYEWP
mgnify:CR=1 FL=1